jgi:hypothetical protein
MLKGTQYGQDRNFYYIQTNNAVEAIILAIKTELAADLAKQKVSQAVLDTVHMKYFLESCGAEEIVNNCTNLLGPNTPGVKGLKNIFPGWPSGPQLDDVVMLYFSDPANTDIFQKEIKWLNAKASMENRYMQFHPVVARNLFGIHAEWKTGRTYEEVVAAIEVGNSVGILLPGHYVSAGLIEDTTRELRIKDSWPGRKIEWAGNGFLQPLTRDEFKPVQQTVIYYKP